MRVTASGCRRVEGLRSVAHVPVAAGGAAAAEAMGDEETMLKEALARRRAKAPAAPESEETFLVRTDEAVPPELADALVRAAPAEDEKNTGTLVYAPGEVPPELQKYARPDDHVVIMVPGSDNFEAVLVTKEREACAALASPLAAGHNAGKQFVMEFTVAEYQTMFRYDAEDPARGCGERYHLWNLALRLRADGGEALCDELIRADMIGTLQECFMGEAAADRYCPGFVQSLTSKRTCGGDASALMQVFEGSLSVLHEMCGHTRGRRAFALAFVGASPDGGATKRGGRPLLDTLSKLVYLTTDLERLPRAHEDVSNVHQGTGAFAATRTQIEQATLDTIGRSLSGLGSDKALRKRFAKAVKASHVRNRVLNEAKRAKKTKWTDLPATAGAISRLLLPPPPSFSDLL